MLGLLQVFNIYNQIDYMCQARHMSQLHYTAKLDHVRTTVGHHTCESFLKRGELLTFVTDTLSRYTNWEWKVNFSVFEFRNFLMEI